jgi:hypothetical protein
MVVMVALVVLGLPDRVALLVILAAMVALVRMVAGVEMVVEAAMAARVAMVETEGTQVMQVKRVTDRTLSSKQRMHDCWYFVKWTCVRGLVQGAAKVELGERADVEVQAVRVVLGVQVQNDYTRQHEWKPSLKAPLTPSLTPTLLPPLSPPPLFALRR